MTTNLEQVFRITGMDCASCAQHIEQGVARLEQVEASTLNFATETLRVQGNVPADTIIARVREMGYEVVTEAETADLPAAPTNFWHYLWQRSDTRLTLIAAVLVLPGLIFHELLPHLAIHHPLIDLASVIAMAVAGYPVARSAWRSLKINRDININVLMTIAAVGAVIIGAYTEAGVVMVLFALGEAIEGYTAARARGAIRSLMAVSPQTATVLRTPPACTHPLDTNTLYCPLCLPEEHTVSIKELAVGERILVKPGARIPMDGRILSGASSVNQAPITGESRPIAKRPSDTVFASTINGEGTLEIEVTHLAADNTISRLIKMVAEAQEKRAPAQRFIDQFARYYTPAVMGLALLVAVIPPLFFQAPFLNGDAPTAGWLYRALALLVVACPCALVISTPVTVISAISNAARHGVLIKGGAYVEALNRVQAIAFDKTGTLTQGNPTVIAVRAANCLVNNGDTCTACDDLLALAHAVEQRSEHPLAQAVTNKAVNRGVQKHYPPATNVTALTGQGVRGQVNGREITIGSHAYFDTHIPHLAHCHELIDTDAAGYTTMLVSDEGQYQGYIAVADAVRESSREAIARLKALGFRSLVMLTGDTAAIAHTIAQQVGITEVRANCLPAHKVTAVADLRQEHDHVAMVGDGINDAPALATASVGIAIGTTAQAMETADVTLMGHDLRQLPFAFQLSRAAMRTIYVNVALSIGIKIAFLLLVILGSGTMWLAVLADMGTSILVTLNGLRLLKRPTMT